MCARKDWHEIGKNIDIFFILLHKNLFVRKGIVGGFSIFIIKA